nr:Uma2 family endonuclease [uncultured Desulfobacter sp.]
MYTLKNFCFHYDVSDTFSYIHPSKKYPDIVITCGDAKFEDNEFDTLINPVVIMEILSDSTELFDRTKKFFHYRKIPTLQEYILISQHECWVEKYTRQNDIWKYQSYEGIDQMLTIESTDCELPLAEIYLNVECKKRI